jgi:hypothetical protein
MTVRSALSPGDDTSGRHGALGKSVVFGVAMLAPGRLSHLKVMGLSCSIIQTGAGRAERCVLAPHPRAPTC